MFNAGVRGKRAKDGVGFLSTAEQFNQKSFLVPTVTSFSITDVSYVPLDNTAVDTAGGETIVINGSGFASGATVQVGATTIGSVTFIDQNRLAFTAPALSSGSYTIYVTNSNGGTGILLSGLVYSGLPTFTTTAGTLGTVYETANINTAVVATGDAPITYSVISGTLPAGANINSNGTITGNAPVDGSSTTYSFTIQASDGQLQDSTRAFTLTINTDVLTWGLANNTVYTLDGGTAMSNVTLSATSAANSNSAVTFAANTLPTGVSLSGNTIFGTPTTEQTVYSTLTATATQTGRTATRFVSWVISLNDLFFKYNTLLIPGASTTFVDDASTNNFAVTINGDTKPNSFNPYTPGYYSNYFDGSGDYLSTSAGASAFDFSSTKTLTFECWFSANSLSGNHTLLSINECQPFRFIVTSSTLIWQATGSGTTILSGSQTWNIGAWYHIACVRNDDTLYMFVNGAQVATASYATSWGATSTSYPVSVGANRQDTFYFNGNISNLRLVKGTALYTSSFTPSTTPLTAVSGTSLLTCQSNRFIDNSTNNFTLAVAGNTTVSSFDPFVPNSSYSTYGSAYSDGTGDYISVSNNSNLAFGTGDYTIEMWLYLNSSAQASLWESNPIGTTGSRPNGFIWYMASGVVYLFFSSNNRLTSSANVIPLKQWSHVALVRNSGTTNFYVNGVSVASTSFNYDSTNGAGIVGAFCDGGTYSIDGYISNLRAVKGTAVYTTAFTPPSEPLTAIANTSLLTLQNNQPVNNSTFLDNSTNNFTITRAGNTTQGTFSPYGGNWSNYFDGTGDYLSFPNNAVFAFGTGSYTIEFWVNGPFASNTFFLTGRQGIGTMHITTGGTDSAAGTLRYVGTSTIASSNVIMDNTWHHCAIVRNGSSNITLYVDGISVATGTDTTNYTNTTGIWYIASNDTSGVGQNLLTGYISNLRIVKGTALYTSNFTPSTTPLTPIANTSLLTCADNRFIDDSINNFTITKIGDSSIQRFSPFNPSSVTSTSYSGYFDGTGDYLTAPSNAAFGFGTGDFTIEFWAYSTSSARQDWIDISDGTNRVLFYYTGSAVTFYGNGSAVITGSAITLNTWTHYALSKSSGSTKMFVNGVQAGSTYATSQNYGTVSSVTIGKDAFGSTHITGYMSNIRIVKGTALYTSNFTPSTTPLTVIANTQLLTCQSPTFIDNSTNNFTITAFGNSQPTQQNPFGYTSATTQGYTVSTIGGSGYFDGTGDYLSLSQRTALSLGTENFTVEAWIYPTGNPASTFYSIIDARGDAGVIPWAAGLRLLSGNLKIEFYTGTQIQGSITVPLNTWTHIAYARSGTTFKGFVNGVVDINTTMSTNLNIGAGTQYIGALIDPASDTGYLSDVRVVKGTALYTSNFVPPSAPLTAIQNTVLLTNMTSAGVYDAAMMTNMETVGDAKLSTAVSKFGGSSMAFDGSGDRLFASSSPNLEFGTGDFTVECWAYWNAGVADGGFVGSVTQGGMDFAYLSGTLRIGRVNQAWDSTFSSFTPTAAVWYHIAFTRNSGTARVFVNGTQVGSNSTNNNSYVPTGGIIIGSSNTSDRPFNGYIDDLRITKGYARYTANFTAPTTTFKIK